MASWGGRGCGIYSEGCEYGTIGGASLRGIRELMIEFHHGPEELLDALIGKGFHCRVMNRRYSMIPAPIIRAWTPATFTPGGATS